MSSQIYTLNLDNVDIIPRTIASVVSTISGKSVETVLSEIDAEKYEKPSTGIPLSDLSSSVQTSLGKADTAIQSHQSLSAYRTSSAQDVIDATKADSSDIPTKTSDLTNDSGFIVKTVSDLTNYYLKSETFTKNEVNTLISAVKQFTYEVASTLPTASANTMNKIYLLPSTSSASGNVKDEFITIDNGSEATTRYTWEQIGSTAIDLSAYRTSSAQDVIDATKANASDIPTKTSDLTNDSGFLTSHQSLSAYRTSSAQDAIDATLQPKNDNNLNTTSKNVVGAINEVNAKVLPTASDDGDSVVYDDGKWIRTRGFGYYVPTESTLLNTTTMDKDDFIQSEDLYMYVFNFSQSYLSGDTYKVTFDGEEYECVAKSQSGSIMFGNFSILDEEEEDTGEPFLFSSYSQYNQCGFIIDYEPTEDIEVKIVGNTYTPHKFDVDLLPHFIEFPSGGDNGEVLTYHTNGVSWDTLIGLPSGGLQGQYLIKTENGFGWEMPEIPEKTSDLTNDSGFIDNEVDDLENYYKKSQTYTKTEANEIISEANQLIAQTYQSKNDNTLSTTAKTVVGAINEHESDISQLNEDLADKITNPNGGTTGQVLTKTATGEAWQTPSGGGGGSGVDYLTVSGGKVCIIFEEETE